MKRLATLSLAVLLAFTAATTAAAAGAADLIGEWNVESFSGEAPPPNVQMKITFVDADTMTMTVTVDGQELGTEEVQYEATDGGEITIFTEDEPEGDTATWEIGVDGKLTITSNEDGQEEKIVMGRA